MCNRYSTQYKSLQYSIKSKEEIGNFFQKYLENSYNTLYAARKWTINISSCSLKFDKFFSFKLKTDF